MQTCVLPGARVSALARGGGRSWPSGQRRVRLAAKPTERRAPQGAKAGSEGLRVPGGGDVIGVFLRTALRHQEAVIAAAAARIVPADGGAGFVDGAASLLDIEEAAGLAEMRVSLAPHGIGLFAIHLGELRGRGLKAQAEMIGQPLHVALLQGDQGVGTAIARTLRTIIGNHAYPPESLQRLC